MITLKNVCSLNGKVETVQIEGRQTTQIDAEGKLTLLPALIDPHVDFCTPGFEQLEDWRSGSQAAIAGGITTVFDSPYNLPPCDHLDQLQKKKRQIDHELSAIEVPLRNYLYLQPSEQHASELSRAKGGPIAIRINLRNAESQPFLERVFQIGAQNNIMLAVEGNVKQAILLAEKYGSQLFLLDVFRNEELDLIRQAKQKQLLIYAATNPQRLFDLHREDQTLWAALHDGTVDAIGSNHSPSSDTKVSRPEIETMLPLLLNAIHEGKLSLDKLVQLTRINIEYIYNMERNKDFVLVDMNRVKTVRGSHLKTKSKFSPYEGLSLKGWPIYTILKGQVYKLD